MNSRCPHRPWAHPLPSSLLVILFLLHLHAYPRPARCVHFSDVTAAAGFKRPFGVRLKYGGAVAADLNGDGWPDFVFGHHDDRSADVYLNARNGSFARVDVILWRDFHGITPFRFHAGEKGMHLVMSQGGGRGGNLNHPLIARVDEDGSLHDVSDSIAALKSARQRGRSAIAVALGSGGLDLILTGATHAGTDETMLAFSGQAPEILAARALAQPFASQTNSYGYVTDVDGDGVMDVVTFQNLSLWRVTGPYELSPFPRDTLPKGMEQRGVSAVAELDFDNDGMWDLFVARDNTTDLEWVRKLPHTDDVLLRNVGGTFVDVSIAAGIPRGLQTRGVTAGDFNNDGFVDLLLVSYTAQLPLRETYVLLLNRGDGTFRTVRTGVELEVATARGDMATAVDYDRDGRLDVVVSEGDWFDKKHIGFYRLLRNTMAVTPARNHMLVRVGAAPSRNATSLHAVVTARTRTLRMMRRVGSPGTAVSNSYVELVHFGLGVATEASDVTVTWVDGSREEMPVVQANTLVTFGII